MRKRRLHRFAAQQKAARNFAHVELPPSRVRPRDGGQIQSHPDVNAYQLGIQHGIQAAQENHSRAIAQVKHNALVAAHSEPYLVMARQGGFDRGFAAGMQAAQKAGAPRDSQFTYSDVEAARRRGFAEGKAAAGGSIPNVDEKSVRKKVCDAMLEQCRVIAESNPNMAPGVNAVKRQIKKHVANS